MATLQEIREAMHDDRRKKDGERSEAKAAQEAYERGASLVYGNIGAFIDALRRDTRLLVMGTKNYTDVKINTGKPTEWEGLPDTTANFLGKLQESKISELLTIRAYEDDHTRTMRFMIGDTQGRMDRWISLSAALTWHGIGVDIECQCTSPVPEHVEESYNYIATLHGVKNWSIEKLTTAEALIAFGGREATKAIRVR